MIEDKIIKEYTKALNKFGKNDRQSILWTKDKQDMRFQVLLGDKFTKSNMSLLDYGSGFSDLNQFLKTHFYNLRYSGCDINNNFIEIAKENYPQSNIFLIKSVDDIKETYDIIVISGTFNFLCIESYEEMENYVFQQLIKLFKKTNYILSINFLSHCTDDEYKYTGHFYLNPTKLYDFAIKNMTQRIDMDTSSLPYEITFKFYKSEDIDYDMTVYKK